MLKVLFGNYYYFNAAAGVFTHLFKDNLKLAYRVIMATFVNKSNHFIRKK